MDEGSREEYNIDIIDKRIASQNNMIKGGSNYADDPRTRRLPISYYDEEDDEEENDEEDQSLDLLVRFIENVFKKVSKRSRKAI